MRDHCEIQIMWKKSESGKVCYASAISENGNVIAEEHIILPEKNTMDYYNRYLGDLGDEEIEKVAQYIVNFRLEHPDLF